MKNKILVTLSAALLIPSLVSAEVTCPSDYASVAPTPSGLVKLCPGEKIFAQPADVEKTGNPLYCSYTFGHIPAMLTLPQGRLRVGSSQGTRISDAMKRTDPKAAAEADARGIASADIKTTVTKMPWSGVEAYRVDTVLAGMSKTGELFYVKSSKGVVTVQLKAMSAIPPCIEKVAEYVAHH